MSKQMPLTDVLNESFRFGVVKYLTILRAVLVPYLMIIVGFIIISLGLVDFANIEAMERGEYDGVAFWPLFNDIFRLGLGGTIVVLIIAGFVLALPLMGAMTSLYRYVGLGEEPGGWFHLRFDDTMWRVVIATIIFTVIQYVLSGIGFGIAYSLNPNAAEGVSEMIMLFQSIDPETMEPGYTPDESVLGLIGFVFLGSFITMILSILILTKLAPFVAATAGENRLMLLSSWRMTKGNFWTILGAYILMMLAFFAINIGYSLVDGVLSTIFALAGDALSLIYTFISVVIQLAMNFFFLGVQVAFAAVIYRTLWLNEPASWDGASGDGDSGTPGGGLDG